MADLAERPAELINRLSSPDSPAREAAAAELYRIGRALGDAALDHTLPGWHQMPDFAPLLAGPPTVGIAVQPDTFEKIRRACGSPRLAEVPPDQDALEFEPLFGHGIGLDILTTKAPRGNGAIARFLKRFGEGIQQVEYPTTDVDRATELLRTRFGQKLIYPQTRAGADGTRVNFFLASTPEGKKVLIELVEARRPGAPKM